MSASVPRPEPEILNLVQTCAQRISFEAMSGLETALLPPEQGASEEPTAEELDAVYGAACSLCDDGNFRFASGLALHVAAFKPSDPRYTFLAGTCMQRLKLHAFAARFFCAALVEGGDHPAALFRLGECLLALGDRTNADHAFDLALDVSRGLEDTEELQHAAQRMMSLITTGARTST